MRKLVASLLSGLGLVVIVAGALSANAHRPAQTTPVTVIMAGVSRL
jgi:hypothetical protein